MGALAGGAGGLGAGLLMGAPAAWHLPGAAWMLGECLACGWAR